MKKMLAFFLAFILVMSLVACAGNTEVNEPTDGTTTSTDLNETNVTEDIDETEMTNASEETDATTVATSDETETQDETTEPEESDVPTSTPSQPTEGHTHDYQSSVKAPTCTDAGYTLHKCDCGDSYKDNDVKATGHKFGAWVTTKEATAFATGTAESVVICNYDRISKNPVISYKRNNAIV